MRYFLFVLVVFLLLIGAGIVLARPLDENGQPGYPAAPTVTIEPYPMPTLAAMPEPENELQLTSASMPPAATKTPPPIIGDAPKVPVIPNE